LKATPAGRNSAGGYNYQRAYAVARLAAMRTTEPVLGLSDYPTRLRYDWAEDLDELLGDGFVCFTQCKRVDDIGEPAKLAEVLSGFAPKWLWSPEAIRGQVRFRLVSCDLRFRFNFAKEADRDAVLANFKSQLATTPSPQSDRAKWQNEADLIGHEYLFNALWQALELVHLPKDVDLNDPDGPLVFAEREALAHLTKWHVVSTDNQKEVLARLRRLLHENLITFDPADLSDPVRPQRAPHPLGVTDVRLALLVKEQDSWDPQFAVVDRLYLATARLEERNQFLFEPPEWRHVVHGADEKLMFIERDQTAALAQVVREQLIAPLLRGTTSLSALFVTGPPGAGKSTLVRRVAAQLIQSGEVVVADAGHNLDPIVPGGLEPYIQYLVKLAGQGRPVLLLLDDPLKAESEWIVLLKHLKRPGLQLSVIAPTPDFLYHSHQHDIRGMQTHIFPVEPPSAVERKKLAGLYGRTLNANEAVPDDFLVMVAEAAEGKRFPEIMVRLWETLNNGHPIKSDAPFKDLPWQVRAFWFVCALHRTSAPCPLPVLQAALALSGGTGDLDVATSLAMLKAQSHWSIFRIVHPASAMLRSAGELVSTAHHKIASVAWEKRPGAWLDGEVNRLLAAASLHAPASVSYVAMAARRLAKAESSPDSKLADELMQQWAEAAVKSQNLETRHLCDLVAILMHEDCGFAQQMSPSLYRRSNGYDGWLAALQLSYLSETKERDRSFPCSIDLDKLIAEADFSIAPKRATKFFSNVREKEYRKAIISRLCASLDGTLRWQINSTLLAWLISHAPQKEMIRRLGLLAKWLEAHDENTEVRTQYLAFLMKLPAEFAEQRKTAVTITERWLEAHDENTEVRTQYLAFLMKLPAQFTEQRKSAATITERWLEAHEENTDVRTQYLAFLMKLPAEFAEQRKTAVTITERWLEAHEENTDVRTQYLAFLMKLPAGFAEQRKTAATITERWLEAHEENIDVRTQYLAFLMKLPAEFAEQRKQAVIDTARWLADSRHDDDTTVRTQYLAFVQQFPPELDEMRKQAALKTAEWLKKHPENFNVCTGYVSFLLAVHHPDLVALEAESIPYHQWIIAKCPQQVGHRFTFGEQLLRLERYAEAKSEYEFVLAREPRHELAHRGLAVALQNLGNTKKAEEVFKRALQWAEEKGGKLAMFHTSLGKFYLGEKHWSQAIESFAAAASECPEYYGNHWGLAKARSELGKLPEARESLERAMADPELRSPAKDEIERMLVEISQRLK
jgi:tetratricopeptide (TPR) repeat protein